MSLVDSASGGKPSTWGRGKEMKSTRGDKPGGIWGSLRRLRGVEMKETRWPLSAKDLESSRKGSMWPKAGHGNATTWRGPSSMIALTSGPCHTVQPVPNPRNEALVRSTVPDLAIKPWVRSIYPRNKAPGLTVGNPTTFPEKNTLLRWIRPLCS
ncbi:hypothetical protein ACMD2_22821 [Ananas comosus]|uniref:Uncharacterized protein n=1 Tax=Ananas comosus TaxID=4615 RepID=A0A199V6E8_ANACO|nr:hypothetical protein ACMD2_22821 [Ananas comosus]